MIKIFAFLGPGIGAILFLIQYTLPIWGDMSLDQKEGYIRFMIPFIVLAGYMLGLVPALIAGFTYKYVFNRESKTKAVKYSISAVAAAIAVLIVTTVMSYYLFGTVLGKFVLVSIFSALVCSGLYCVIHLKRNTQNYETV